MKILVTGSAGFIGSHVAKKLLEQGDEVIGVDNFSDYYDPQLKEKRVSSFLSAFEKFSLYRTDIINYSELEKIFQENKIDKVCHLAAIAGVRYSLENPFAYEQTNITGTLNLLEICRHQGIQDFIFASSSSVYGNNKELPFSEEHRVDTPISIYAVTKKSNEEMAHAYHHLFGLNCTGLRFFTAYGPWGRPDMALFLFTKNILEKKPINVFNSGDMIRDFTYIDDIVSGVVSAISKSYPYEIFNLARGETIQLLEYIKEVENNLGIEAIKNMMPMQPGDIPVASADISKARKLLDYNPKTSVKEGVKNFVNWYKEYYKI